jgi:hypothetical protein
MDVAIARKALNDFISTIEVTGGVSHNDKGYIVPIADPEWYDLGCVYELACMPLGRKPRVVPFPKR